MIGANLPASARRLHAAVTSAGRHFLQIPGPTNVPDRVLRAIDNPTMDHRGPDFGRARAARSWPTCGAIFQTSGPVVIYPASGTGAWEAALANTLSPGDTVLMCRTGWFATLWKEMARAARPRADLHRDRLAARRRRAGDRRGAGRRHARTGSRRSAWCTTRPRPAAPSASPRCARAMDAAGHPALLMVDTISSLGIDGLPARRMGRRRHRRRLAEGPDAAARPVVQRDQREGAEGDRKRATCRAATGTGGRCWRPTRPATSPTRPATNLLYGLNEAVKMLLEEGLAQRVRPP